MWCANSLCSLCTVPLSSTEMYYLYMAHMLCTFIKYRDVLLYMAHMLCTFIRYRDVLFVHGAHAVVASVTYCSYSLYSDQLFLQIHFILCTRYKLADNSCFEFDMNLFCESVCWHLLVMLDV